MTEFIEKSKSKNDSSPNGTAHDNSGLRQFPSADIIQPPNFQVPPRAPLTIAEWKVATFTDPVPLLGELFTTTSRTMLSAGTGLGKTHLAMAWGLSMAAGRDFGHWKGGGRPARVLLIDGEMSARAMRKRMLTECRRMGVEPPTFYLLCREQHPDMLSLDTEEGQQWLTVKIAGLGGVDFIIFDSVMCLTKGDMKDESAWQPVAEWMQELTRQHIGTLWINHTGHKTGQSYGTKTREWQLDSVIIGDAACVDGADLSMRLTFTKARGRHKDNWNDFSDVTVALQDDTWAVSEQQPRSTTSARDEFLALLISTTQELGKPAPNQPATNRAIKREHFKQLFSQHRATNSESKDAARMAFNRAEKLLRDEKIIKVSSCYIWVI